MEHRAPGRSLLWGKGRSQGSGQHVFDSHCLRCNDLKLHIQIQISTAPNVNHLVTPQDRQDADPRPGGVGRAEEWAFQSGQQEQRHRSQKQWEAHHPVGPGREGMSDWEGWRMRCRGSARAWKSG